MGGLLVGISDFCVFFLENKKQWIKFCKRHFMYTLMQSVRHLAEIQQRNEQLKSFKLPFFSISSWTLSLGVRM